MTSKKHGGENKMAVKIQKHKVIVYSAQWCPWCHKEMDWLKEHNIPFEERDVDKDPKFAEEAVEKSGETSLPITDIDGKIIPGFDLEALKEALGIKE